jgi:hypothetical protein
MRMIACVHRERTDYVRAILQEFERIQDTKWSLVDPPRVDFYDRFWAKALCFGWIKHIVLHGGYDISHTSQAHAWFLSLVAREGLVWYCWEHWSRIPTSDQQLTGTIILAGLLFRVADLTKSREQVDLLQHLLRSGVDPNKKCTWSKYDGFGDNADEFGASLWEAYVEAFPRLWRSKSETDISWVLEAIQLLLHDGRADKNCCLPAGKRSLLSALTLDLHHNPRPLKYQNHSSRFAGRLHCLLDAHGLLTREERHVALEQGWILTELEAPHPLQNTPMQPATESDAEISVGPLGKLDREEEAARP